MWRWVAIGAGGLLLVGAAIFYFAAVPGMAGDDYQERAKPEHERIRVELHNVLRTFSSGVLGADDRADRAKTRKQWLKLFRRDVAARRLRLFQTESAITNARNAFEFPERDKLLDVPGWPLIQGRGDLGAANDVADLERDYLRKSTAFLRSYERLVRWFYSVTAFNGRVGKIIGYGVERALRAAKSGPDKAAARVDQIVRGLRSELRRFRVRHAPAELRREHRIITAAGDFYVREFRGLARAVRTLDFQAATRFDRTLPAGERRYGRKLRKLFPRLLTRSSYARSVRELRRLERRIAKEYDRI